MFLSIDNPVYNTVIVFSIIMLLVYMIKPDIVYGNEKQEFRQFGTTEGKTLLPIYIVGILLAIILYIFFHYLSNNYNWKGEEEFTSNNKSSNIHNKTRKKATIILDSDNCDNKSL